MRGCQILHASQQNIPSPALNGLIFLFICSQKSRPKLSRQRQMKELCSFASFQFSPSRETNKNLFAELQNLTTNKNDIYNKKLQLNHRMTPFQRAQEVLRRAETNDCKNEPQNKCD